MMKRPRSYFLPITGWLLILVSILLIPLLVMQNIALNQLFADGVMDDTTITAFNRLEITFYSNLREFLALMLLYALLLLMSAVALLRRRRWARISLTTLFLLALFGIALVILAYFYYDYQVTIWREAERNERFVRNSLMILGGSGLLLVWLIYKLNSPRILQKLKPWPVSRDNKTSAAS